MKRTKSVRSKKEVTEEPTVVEKVEESKLNPNWNEEEIRLAKKYYELYVTRIRY